MTLKRALKSLAGEVIEFAKKDFNKKAYFFTALLVIVLLIANYELGLEEHIVRESFSVGKSWWVVPIFYLVIYFAAAIPTLIFRKEFGTLRSPAFYLKSSFFIVLYGFSLGFYKYSDLTFVGLLDTEVVYVTMLISQLKGAVIFFLPVLLMKLTIDKQINGIYGIARHPKHLNAYLMLFVVMVPFLILTSFTGDFLKAYPQFCPWYFEDIFGMSTWEYTVLYELAYALDFVMTELVFRGMLVIGLMAVMGRSAVLPMVALYCTIHFAKPVLEAISSIFGGYILGALAYQTRHIWGGIMVHICIAITMEIMGFVHYYLLKN